MPEPIMPTVPEFRPDRPKKTHPLEQSILGIVKAGGQTVKGVSGIVSMAANAKLKEADDFDAGKLPLPKGYTPVSERYKDEPWYKRVGKQIRDGFNMSPTDPNVLAMVKRNSGAQASAARQTLQSVKDRADKEYDDAENHIEKEIDPRLGAVGNATNFAANLVPGQRALDIPNAIGASKSVSGAVVPAAANFATRKLKKAGDLVRNSVQQAIQQFVPDRPKPPERIASGRS